MFLLHPQHTFWVYGQSKIILEDNTLSSNVPSGNGYSNIIQLHDNSLGYSDITDYGKVSGNFNISGKHERYSVDTNSLYNFPKVEHEIYFKPIDNGFKTNSIWISAPLTTNGLDFMWGDTEKNGIISQVGFSDNTTKWSEVSGSIDETLNLPQYKNILDSSNPKMNNITFVLSGNSVNLTELTNAINELPSNLYNYNLWIIFKTSNISVTGTLELSNKYNTNIFITGDKNITSLTHDSLDIENNAIIKLRNLSHIHISNILFKGKLESNTELTKKINYSLIYCKNVKNAMIKNCGFCHTDTAPLTLWNWDDSLEAQKNYIDWTKNPLKFSTYSLIYNESSNIVIDNITGLSGANFGVITYKNAKTAWLPDVSGWSSFNFKYITPPTSKTSQSWEFLPSAEWIPDSAKARLDKINDLGGGIYQIPNGLPSIINCVCGNSLCTMLPISEDYKLKYFNPISGSALDYDIDEQEKWQQNFQLNFTEIGSAFNHSHEKFIFNSSGSFSITDPIFISLIQKLKTKLINNKTFKYDTVPGMLTLQADTEFEKNNIYRGVGYHLASANIQRLY